MNRSPLSHALRSVLTCLLPLLLLLLPPVAHAATLNVPSQYPTIQAGINAAANGDTVLIADGTASIWNLNNTSGVFSQSGFGPCGGWSAIGISAAP